MAGESSDSGLSQNTDASLNTTLGKDNETTK